MAALSEEQNDELRERLDDARAAVLEQIRMRRGVAGDPGSASHLAHLGQPDDMSQAIELGDNDMALLSQEQDLLRDVDSAIERVNEGIANVCIACGQDIAFERLLAVPTAQTCIACQQAAEKAEHRSPAPTM